MKGPIKNKFRYFVSYFSFLLLIIFLLLLTTPEKTGNFMKIQDSNIECQDGLDNDNDGLTDWQYDLGCYNQNDTTEYGDGTSAGMFVQDNGWTVFEPSNDTIIVYISSSTGNDSYDGLSGEWNGTSGPKRTLLNGMLAERDYCGTALNLTYNCDYGCSCDGWILLKRGDNWTDEYFGNQYGGYGEWDLSGNSTSQPFVLGSYGNSTTRPRINVNPGNAAGISGSGNLSIVGIEFYNYQKDVENPNFTGNSAGYCLPILRGNNTLVENVKLSYCGIYFQNLGNTNNFTLRRSVITDAYSINSHSQGIYTSNATDLLIEENLFNHNGWNEDFSFVLTSPNSNYSAWKNVGDGQFGIVLNSDTYNISGVNFSLVNNMSDVSEVIENAINSIVGSGVVNFTWTQSNVFLVQSTLEPSDGYSITNYFGSSNGTNISSSLFNQTYQGAPGATIFNRNMYLSYGYGRTTVRKNIDANGASGGIQQRMGGINDNNLILRNPLAISLGHAENPANSFISGEIKNNVVLGSRDIDGQPRGFGISAGSSSSSFVNGLEVYNNIVAHNSFGSSNIQGITISGYTLNLDVHDNIVYNWSRPVWPSSTDHRAYGFSLTGNSSSMNTSFRENIIQQPQTGFVGSGNATGISLYNNTYYSAEDDPPSAWSIGWFDISSSVNSSYWISANSEQNANLSELSFPNASRNIESYMTYLGLNSSYETFIEEAKEQSNFNWRLEFTAPVVNEYIRDGFGIGLVECGDGSIELDETCDDNNTISNDGCSSSCEIEGEEEISENDGAGGSSGGGGSSMILSKENNSESIEGNGEENSKDSENIIEEIETSNNLKKNKMVKWINSNRKYIFYTLILLSAIVFIIIVKIHYGARQRVHLYKTE